MDLASGVGVGGLGGSFGCGDSGTGIAFALAKSRLTADFSRVTQVGLRAITPRLPACSR